MYVTKADRESDNSPITICHDQYIIFVCGKDTLLIF